SLAGGEFRDVSPVTRWLTCEMPDVRGVARPPPERSARLKLGSSAETPVDGASANDSGAATGSGWTLTASLRCPTVTAGGTYCSRARRICEMVMDVTRSVGFSGTTLWLA